MSEYDSAYSPMRSYEEMQDEIDRLTDKLEDTEQAKFDLQDELDKLKDLVRPIIKEYNDGDDDSLWEIVDLNAHEIELITDPEKFERYR